MKIDSCFDGCNAPDRDYGGVTYSDAVRKSDNRHGVLVSFQCSKDMSMDYCCHEASHACDAIEDAIGMEHGDEPSAYYLIGWIASCINKARLGIGDFVELKDKEELRSTERNQLPLKLFNGMGRTYRKLMSLLKMK